MRLTVSQHRVRCKENKDKTLNFVTCFNFPMFRSLLPLAVITRSPQTESNPAPLPDLYFDLFSYPVASIVFGDMAIVSLFLLLYF